MNNDKPKWVRTSPGCYSWGDYRIERKPAAWGSREYWCSAGPAFDDLNRKAVDHNCRFQFTTLAMAKVACEEYDRERRERLHAAELAAKLQQEREARARVAETCPPDMTWLEWHNLKYGESVTPEELQGGATPPYVRLYNTVADLIDALECRHPKATAKLKAELDKVNAAIEAVDSFDADVPDWLMGEYRV